MASIDHLVEYDRSDPISIEMYSQKLIEKPRLLTLIECEGIQGFSSDWTKECLVDGEKVEMPANKRRFIMGNAPVVNLVDQMENNYHRFMTLNST